MQEFQIELRPHIGKRFDSRIGEVEVRHNQDLLMFSSESMNEARGVAWTQLGYVGHETNTIEFLPHARALGREVIDAICDRVGEMTKRDRKANLPPQPMKAENGPLVPDLDEVD